MRFRGEYGRLCSLAAQALNAGVSRDLVFEAMLGQGDEERGGLGLIRRQRAIAHLHMREAVGLGADRAAIVEVTLQAKRAVEGEWGQTVPLTRARGE